MAQEKYFFQKKKNTFTRKFFQKGFSAASYVLFALKESGKLALRDLPSCYPGIKLAKDIFGVESGKYDFTDQTIRTNLRRLEKQGLVARDPKRKICFLTEEGENFIGYIEDRYLLLKQPWDGKLRIVIFDIPENKRYWRKWLRRELILLQYVQAQKSVYVGKIPLPKSLYEEIAKSGLQKNIFVLTAGEIDRKEEILNIFDQE